MQDFPETPEAIALVLLFMVLARQCEKSHDPPRLLDLYAECLRTVTGKPRLAGASVRDTIH